MAWLKVDDGLAEHRKILQLKRSERWTWVELLCYVARQNNGGHVPQTVREVLRYATPAFLERCRELGLLDMDGDLYRVHDWEIYNGQTIDERVAAYLEQNPDATANEIVKQIGGTRNVILDAVRRYRKGGI